jgi:AraC family transcriptional regulator
MERLKKGKFYGNSRKQFNLNGLTIVDSEFTNFESCPWHYHENAHFAFTTNGNLIETHRKEKIQLSKGFLMFNNSQDPHFNSHYSENVSALHIDIDEKWFEKHLIPRNTFEGVLKLHDPSLKYIFLKINREIKNFDHVSALAIEGLVLQAMAEMMRTDQGKKTKNPLWVEQVKEMLQERFAEKLSLAEISAVLGIHPVYLSQQFPVYFNDTFGDYIRKIRIRQALDLINDQSASIVQIANSCGFSDQSHFTRCFKRIVGTTPAAYRELLK